MCANYQKDQHLHTAISDALETERRRLASRLHDKIIPQINLIQAQLSVYQATATSQSSQSYAILMTLIQQLSQQVYTLENDLNPSILESSGLIAAIENTIYQQRQMTGANFSLRIGHHIQRLPLQIELALFRWIQHIIQQALEVRQSSQITIFCDMASEAFQLIISENGLQRDPAPSVATERLVSIGGTVTVSKSRYGGIETRVTIELHPPVDLTEREQDVIYYLAQGLTNKEIAIQLDVKPRTVKFHLDNIYSKLNVHTRTEAAIYALQNRLTE